MAKYVKYDDVLDTINSLGYSCETDEQADGWDNAIDTAIERLKNIPAADVQEVRHGHWIQIDDAKCKCSICDTIAFIALYPSSSDKNYCPSCGARMDGDPHE